MEELLGLQLTAAGLCSDRRGSVGGQPGLGRTDAASETISSHAVLAVLACDFGSCLRGENNRIET